MLLRPGGLSRQAIEGALGRPLTGAPTHADGDAPLAPGMLTSHYAPRTPLRLEAESVTAGEALLAFGSAPPQGADEAAQVLNLSARGSIIEAAANLFSYLRLLDGAGATAIAVMPIPHDGLGEAINDRLRRAAAPR
jgi:L-threonylcarbamoyladenylate synthase